MTRDELVTALRGITGFAGTLTEDRVLAQIDVFIAAERERLNPCQPWEQCEAIDFSVESMPGPAGIVWIWLKCSACGNVQAAAEPNDLGHLTVVAQSHFVRKHADLITEPPTRTEGIPPS